MARDDLSHFPQRLPPSCANRFNSSLHFWFGDHSPTPILMHATYLSSVERVWRHRGAYRPTTGETWFRAVLTPPLTASHVPGAAPRRSRQRVRNWLVLPDVAGRPDRAFFLPRSWRRRGTDPEAGQTGASCW